MCLHVFFFFYRTNAKGAPLNINKVSNSLINFGRKLISPAAAPGGAGGPVAVGSGGTPSPAAAPTRTLAEAPRHALQQQQQRLMKSESMPVQLNRGKGGCWNLGLPHLTSRNHRPRTRD